MTDLVFNVEMDRLLARKPTAMREERIKKLELRAAVEEIERAEREALNERNVRRTSRNNYVYGTDEFHYVPPTEFETEI